MLVSVTYTLAGVHPGLMDGLGEMTPEMMHGSPWHDEYLRIAPRPEDFPTLFAKKTAMDQQIKDLSDDDIRAIESPTLLIVGDSDLVAPSTRSRCSASSVVACSGTPRPGCPTRSSRSCLGPRTCRSRPGPTC